MRLRVGPLTPWHVVRVGRESWRAYVTPWIRRLDDGAELVGVCLPARRRIYVARQDAPAMRATLAHEWLHAMMTDGSGARGDASAEERLVCAAEPAFALHLDSVGYWRQHPLPAGFTDYEPDEED